MTKKILVTGAAGFIGSHVVQTLIERGDSVVGRGEPVLLSDFVALLEEQVGRKARLRTESMPKTDIPYTYADITKAAKLLDYQPQVTIQEGTSRFLDWYEQAIVKGR